MDNQQHVETICTYEISKKLKHLVEKGFISKEDFLKVKKLFRYECFIDEIKYR